MPIVSLAEWDRYLDRYPNAHLLQTGAWGELKARFGWKAIRIINQDAGAQVLFRRLPLGFTIGYIPKANPAASLWPEIDLTARRNRAIFLKLEPDAWEGQNSGQGTNSSLLITSPHNIQPPRSSVVDLRGSDEEILARMKQKTRYNIRLAEKKSVMVRAWDDFESFHRMLLLTSERDGFGVHTLDYYRCAYELLHPKEMGELLVAEFEGMPLAALFVARNGNRAYYLYGASTNEERNRMPTYLLQWEAMRWAKVHGCEEYDLWGVPDEDEAALEANFEKRNDGLWGVYRFKRGFGGQLRRAMQAMDRVYHPLLYRVYLRFVGNRE